MKRIICIITVWMSASICLAQSAKEYVDSGIVKNKSKNFGDAINDFNKAIEADPQCEDAWFMRGTLKNILNDYSGALVDLNKALDIKSLSDKAGTGENGNRMKDESGSRKVNKVIQNYSCLYCHLGYAKAKLDDPVAAITNYDKAIDANPKRGESFYRRGLVKLLTGKREEGCQDLSKAKELGYKQAEEALKNYCP